MTMPSSSTTVPAVDNPAPLRETIDIVGLYRKYHDELVEVSRKLRPIMHRMQRQGDLTTYGDAEGEMCYMLIRETQPELLFEISPNAGWSSNYLLAALTKNGKGTLHSFDIIETLHGKPMEQAIRDNQHPDWDQKRFVVHIGDARELTKTVPGTVDFLMIDSDHTDVFAQWYIKEIIPRVKGYISIQDITFYDRRESSTEATEVLQWLERVRIDAMMVNTLEREARAADVRLDFAERRNLRSNSVILRHPFVHAAKVLERIDGPDELLKKAGSLLNSDPNEAQRCIDRSVNLATNDPTRVNRHRIFMKAAEYYTRVGNSEEGRRMAQRSFGLILSSDYQQRKKTLSELLLLCLRQGRLWLAAQTALHILLLPASWSYTVRTVTRFIASLLRN